VSAPPAGTVTVIMPTYNEASLVAECLTSVIEDPSLEVLVVDGGSTDATRDIVTRLMPRFPGLRLLDNPRRTAASAMNLGLAHATGRIIVRLDAHSVYPPGYVRRLTAALDEHGADVAGGVILSVPRRQTAFGRAVAASLTNRWVMGNTSFRVGGGEVRVVDTVPFGCWRADTLRQAGGFNESLHRSQDYDLSQRLKRTGAKIILIPDVLIEYHARSGMYENVRYNYWNGYWVGYPVVAAGVRFAVRHFVAASACVLAVALVVVSLLVSSPWPLLLGAPYLVVLAMSAAAAARAGLAVALWLPPITFATHLLYGLGTFHGLGAGLVERLRRPERAGLRGEHAGIRGEHAGPPADQRRVVRAAAGEHGK
jgi:glycosyltransferase involved in cell wall biosynthesis